MRGGYYRPMYVHRVQVGLDADGKPVAWDHAIVGQSILAGTPFEPCMVKNGVDATSVEGVADSPYLDGDRRPPRRAALPEDRRSPCCGGARSATPTPRSSMESIIDELAHAAGKDPLAYRLALLAGHPRHRACSTRRATKAGWGTPLPAGRARGIAVHESFGSSSPRSRRSRSTAARIRVHGCLRGRLRHRRQPATRSRRRSRAASCSASRPRSTAKITFKDGRVEQSNFHDYPVLRMHEMPKVEVHIVPSTEKPSGVGEPGTPPIAPALCNALFALTGRRLRSLPLVRHGFESA